MNIFLIILICIVLFLFAVVAVPLKYNAHAYVNDERAEYAACVKLIMGLIMIKILYDSAKPVIEVRLFGIRIIKKTIEKHDYSNKRTKNKNNEKFKMSSLKEYFEFFKDIVRIIKPKEFVVEGTYGFEDPGVTGVVCSVYYMIKPLVRSCRINLKPVFNEECFDIKAHMSGQFIIIKVLYKIFMFYIKKHKKVKQTDTHGVINNIKYLNLNYGGNKNG